MPYAAAPYDGRFSGPMKAAEALALARERLTTREAARARYAKAKEARERREITGGAGEALAELRAAEEAARKAARRADSACAWHGDRGRYGPGTWQGAEEAPEHARKPFSHGHGFLASAMHGGKHGEIYALHDDSGDVLRNVADAGDVARLGHGGWYDNPHGESFHDGSGLVIGVVGQLRGRDGLAAFVPGYRFGGHDDSGTFDLRDVYKADGPEDWQAEEAREEAARAADGLAESAAERERDYQTAWAAGQAWDYAGERLAEIRGEIRATLAERREMKAASPGAALCALLREAIESKLAERAEIMRERAELAERAETMRERLREAFCEGAGIDAMPGEARA